MRWRQCNLVVEPPVPIPARNDQPGKRLGSHLCTIDLDHGELVLGYLIDPSVDRHKLRVGTIDGAAKTCDLLLGQFRIDLRNSMLNRLDGTLKLADAIPITGKQGDRECADLLWNLVLQDRESGFTA